MCSYMRVGHVDLTMPLAVDNYSLMWCSWRARKGISGRHLTLEESWEKFGGNRPKRSFCEDFIHSSQNLHTWSSVTSSATYGNGINSTFVIYLSAPQMVIQNRGMSGGRQGTVWPLLSSASSSLSILIDVNRWIPPLPVLIALFLYSSRTIRTKPPR